MPRTPRLRVERLEPRDVPAGNVTAVVTNGVLVLTGDEDSNQLTFRMAAGGVTLTPSDDTSVNGRGPNVVVPLAAATGLKADLGDGDDILTLDADADLALPRGAVIALGDGFNTLDLTTTGTIALASLVVTGTDGFDFVAVGGGAGRPSKIAGAATFALGDGGGSTELSNLDLPGAAGLKVSAGAGDDDLILTGVTVAKAVSAKLGAGTTNNLAVVGGRLGGLSAASNGGNLTLTDTTVAGNATFGVAALTRPAITGTTIAGTLTIKSTQSQVGGVLADFFGVGAVGGLAITAVGDAYATFRPGSSWTAARDVVVASRNSFAQLNLTGGAIAARALTVTSREAGAALNVRTNGRATVGRDVTVSAPNGAGVFQSTGGDLVAAGDVKVAATREYAAVSVSAGDLAARHVRVTSGGNVAYLSQDGPSTIDLAGGLALAGGSQASVQQSAGGALAVAGDLTVVSRDSAKVMQTDATTTLAVGGDLTVRGDFGTMSFSATGQSVAVGGATTLDGGFKSDTTLTTGAISTLTGPVRVGGGARVSAAKVDADANTCRVENAVAGSDVEIAGTGGGSFDVRLGAPGRPVTIGGGLRLHTAGSADAVALRALTVGGATALSTGGGNDALTIDDGSTFTGTFTADLGSGNDTIAIAQDAGQAAPVTFSGKATIKAGAGADTLQLGRLAGDANSTAVFAAAGSQVDAGTGKDLFDDDLGQFEGLAPGTGIVGWDDPTI